jgi:integrase
LGKLMDAYVEHLRQQKKASYADTRNLVRLHIQQAHAVLCQRKASEITASELRKVINLVKDAGHLRTAAKVRSYLRAAFALGVGAEGNTNLPESFMGFGIDSNPAAALSPIKRNSVPGERALSISELQSYIRRVNELESPVTKRALLLALYLGGQRMEQLLHVRRSDINLSEGLVCLRDGKGKRDVPRLHWLPLSEQTAGWFSELLAMNSPETGLLFSMDGVRPMVAVTASKAVARIAAAMVKSGETDSESSRFKMIDIRRTCETQLARLKISKDIRAQLLSHGLGGVQDRHYDQHTYLDEKRLALATWEQFLAGEGQISADVLRFVRAA